MSEKVDLPAAEKLVRILSGCTPYITLHRLPENHPTLAKVNEMQLRADFGGGITAEWGVPDDSLRLVVDASGSASIVRTVGTSSRTEHLFEDVDGGSTRLALLLVGMFEPNAWGSPTLS